MVWFQCNIFVHIYIYIILTVHSGCRGETWLHAGTLRRNIDNQGKRKRISPGQKVDMIVTLRGLGWEIFVGEVSPPSARSIGDKVQSDRVKLMTEMKDALDWLLDGPLCEATLEEMQEVFVMGMQVVGMYCIIVLCYWCICRIH
jgi:hypothetical protein